MRLRNLICVFFESLNGIVYISIYNTKAKFQWRIHKDSPIICILSRINPIPRTDIYLFKILVYSNVVFPSTSRLSIKLFIVILIHTLPSRQINWLEWKWLIPRSNVNVCRSPVVDKSWNFWVFSGFPPLEFQPINAINFPTYPHFIFLISRWFISSSYNSLLRKLAIC